MKKDKKTWLIGLVVAIILLVVVFGQMGNSRGITSLRPADSNSTSPTPEEPRYVDLDLPIWMDR